MGDPGKDLWNEFSETEGVTDDFTGKFPPNPKSTETDGSEWTGKFDRRSLPRDENPDTNSSEDSTP